MRTLTTRAGEIKFPAVFPVTTFGDRYPLDKLLRPYLPRMAAGVMTSYHYAQEMQPQERPRCPLMIDSSGFVLIKYEGSIRVEQAAGGEDIGIIVVQDGENEDILHPKAVLDLQCKVADIGFTLDLACPPGLDEDEAQRRLHLSTNNALWALHHRWRRDMPLYGVVPVWTTESTCRMVEQFKGFDGIALGGIVPRIHDLEFVKQVITAVRAMTDQPLHVLGIGSPAIIEQLFAIGVDSVDSSGYIHHAAQFKDIDPFQRRDLALTYLAQMVGKTMPLSTMPLFKSINTRTLS